MNYKEITPQQLARRLDAGEPVRIIDVREPLEHQIASIEAAELLPLSRFDEWVTSLDREEEIVFMCHHGIRSGQVCTFLSRQGFDNLYNLAGGIDRWSYEVDSSVPTY